MRYWPMSVLLSNPLMPVAYRPELERARDQRGFVVLSPGAQYACGDVARHTSPVNVPNLRIIESLDCNWKRFFVDYPENDEWLRLERTGVLEDDAGNQFLVFDVLH